MNSKLFKAGCHQSEIISNPGEPLLLFGAIYIGGETQKIGLEIYQWETKFHQFDNLCSSMALSYYYDMTLSQEF